MSDFNELMKQAKQLKERMERAKEDLAATVVEGQAGAGAVRVRMNGRYDAIGVKLDEAIAGEDRKILEDLICAAVNDAGAQDRTGKSAGHARHGWIRRIPARIQVPFLGCFHEFKPLDR